MQFSVARATADDVPALCTLMDLAISRLQADFLSPAQIAASRTIMGLDSQLIEDGTYFFVRSTGRMVGSSGWSRRATLYGGDHSAGLRAPRLLDPRTEPARIRAMYTHPDFARRGIGRLILRTCENAAKSEGFEAFELMATLSGEPLYRAMGYATLDTVTSTIDGVAVPLARMGKSAVRSCRA